METQQIKIQRLENLDDLGLLIEGDIIEGEFKDYQGMVVVGGTEHHLELIRKKIDGEEGGGIKVYLLTRDVHLNDGKIIGRNYNSHDVTWYNHGDLYQKYKKLLENNCLM